MAQRDINSTVEPIIMARYPTNAKEADRMMSRRDQRNHADSSNSESDDGTPLYTISLPVYIVIFVVDC